MTDELQSQNAVVVALLAYARKVCNELGSRRTAVTWWLGESIVEVRYTYLEGQLIVTPPGQSPRTLIFRGRHPDEDLAAVKLALTAAARHGRLAV